MAFTTSKEIAFSSSGQKDLVLTFTDGTTITNDDIASESLSIDQTLCDESTLNFGKCCANVLKLKVLASVGSHKGETFTATMTSGSETISLGTYYVYSDSRTDDKAFRNIVAYDWLKKASSIDVASWYNGLTFPMTVKAFRDSLFTYLGITQETVTLPNDTLSIGDNVSVTSISAYDMITYICQANVCFGQINADGNFEYVTLAKPTAYDTAHTYTNDEIDMNGLTYEDWSTQAVSKLTIRDNSIVTTEGSYGTGTNEFLIEDNPIFAGLSSDEMTTVAETLYNLVSGITFTPSSISAPFNSSLALGDFVQATGYYDTVEFPVLKRTISGITALKDSISADGEETYTNIGESITKQIAVVKKVVTSTASEVAELEENVYTEGTTEINGGNITTDSIKATSIDIDDLFAKDIYATGSINGATITTDSGEIAGFTMQTSDDTYDVEFSETLEEIIDCPNSNNYRNQSGYTDINILSIEDSDGSSTVTFDTSIVTKKGYYYYSQVYADVKFCNTGYAKYINSKSGHLIGTCIILYDSDGNELYEQYTDLSSSSNHQCEWVFASDTINTDDFETITINYDPSTGNEIAKARVIAYLRIAYNNSTTDFVLQSVASVYSKCAYHKKAFAYNMLDINTKEYDELPATYIGTDGTHFIYDNSELLIDSNDGIKLDSTVETYVPPTIKEVTTLNNLILNSTYDSNYDIDESGTLDALDLIAFYQMSIGNKKPSEYSSFIKQTDANFQINLQDLNNAIVLSGTNMWGSTATTSIGLGAVKSENLVANSSVQTPLLTVKGDGGIHDSVNITGNVVASGTVDGSNLYYHSGDTISTTGCWVGGGLTSSSKNLVFLIPFSKQFGDDVSSVSCTSMSITLRHPDGGYPYARSGSSGATYTQLGSDYISIWSSGKTARTNEVSSLTCTVLKGIGLKISISFTYGLAKASGSTTVVTNNVPMFIALTGTFTVS